MTEAAVTNRIVVAERAYHHAVARFRADPSYLNEREMEALAINLFLAEITPVTA